MSNLSEMETTPNTFIPPHLKKNDLIGIIAPASPMDPALLEKGIRYIEKQGFRVKLGKYVYEQRDYLAGSDQQRADDFNNMFLDKEVRAIFCVRGGYGTPRLLSLIDYKSIIKNPKIFVGYSDITALQLAIFKETSLVTFSGPMVAVEMARGIDPFTEENFWSLLTEPKAYREFCGSTENRIETLTEGIFKGRLLGGCMSLIVTMLGSQYLPSFKRSIFFAEDVGEKIYRIDRHLVQLREAGILNNIGGFVLGQMLDCKPSDHMPALHMNDLLDDFIKPLKVPAICNFEYGHHKRKYTMPIGVYAELHIEKDITRFRIVDTAVS